MHVVSEPLSVLLLHSSALISFSLLHVLHAPHFFFWHLHAPHLFSFFAPVPEVPAELEREGARRHVGIAAL